MTTVADRLFVDTNILLYSTDPTSPLMAAARRALRTVRRQGETPTLSPQIVREYLVAFSRGVGGVVPPIGPILENIERILREVDFVGENELVARRLLALLRDVPAAGKQVHDANIVATMQVHGIRRLLTHNEAHFTRFSHLITVVPLRSFQ
jgi:predicted nucleic acid-binding protein